MKRDTEVSRDVSRSLAVTVWKIRRRKPSPWEYALEKMEAASSVTVAGANPSQPYNQDSDTIMASKKSARQQFSREQRLGDEENHQLAGKLR